MNLLLDKAPHEVRIAGDLVPIRADFRQSIRFEQLMQDEAASDEEKLLRGLILYYGNVIEPLDEAVERMLWFYRCGRDDEEKSDTGSKLRGPIYSYDYDDRYIYAAFLDQYRINLQAVEFLHWWEFRALFAGLKQDAEIVKIMGYRAMDIPNDLPKQQKDFYQRMKRLYAVPLPKIEQEKQKALEDALENGGDISGLL